MSPKVDTKLGKDGRRLKKVDHSGRGKLGLESQTEG